MACPCCGYVAPSARVVITVGGRAVARTVNAANRRRRPPEDRL